MNLSQLAGARHQELLWMPLALASGAHALVALAPEAAQRLMRAGAPAPPHGDLLARMLQVFSIAD